MATTVAMETGTLTTGVMATGVMARTVTRSATGTSARMATGIVPLRELQVTLSPHRAESLVQAPAFAAPRRTQAQASAPGLRLTARGRALLRALAAVAVLAFVLLAGARFAGASASPELGERVAAPGESLWTIAESIDPQGDPRVMVMRLHELNPEIGTGPLVAGQSLRVPLK